MSVYVCVCVCVFCEKSLKYLLLHSHFFPATRSMQSLYWNAASNNNEKKIG